MFKKNQANNNVPRGPAAGTTASWLVFPIHEKLAGPEGPGLLSNLEQNYSKLESLTKTGQVAEKARARVALGAYSRALELLNSIRDLQEEMRNGSK